MSFNSSATPLVSIILITYNRARLIDESIRSVLAQTYTNWELIIIDDGSDDETADIIQQYDERRLHYSFVPHTGMLGAVRNLGISKAKGDFIAFQDSDDIWREDKLAIQLQLFKKYPEISFALSNNTQFGEHAVHPPDYNEVFVGDLFSSFLIQNRFHFCGTSLIFKKEVLQKVGMLEESQPRMRELHFFLRMSHEFKGIFTNDRLVNVRRHQLNTSNRYNVDAHWSMIDMLKDFQRNEIISRREYRQLAGSCYYKIGLHYAGQKKTKLAWRHFLMLIRLRPFYIKGWVRAIENVIRSAGSLLDKRTAAP